MGEVFRGTDEQLGRPVAVKLLLPSEDSSRAAERFHREARTAARLSDPHVVSVYDFGQHADGFYLVMELVEGHTVAAELAEHGSLPKERAIDIVEQAATGLAAAHREGVVHRDVKPANLLVTADGTVKVADFGIAHLPGEGSATLTVTGEIIGSMHYLAPERAKGAPAGQAADVYSLGCVLYHLVTGQPPFTAEHPAAILYQHVDASPTLPSLTQPELGGAFEHALLRMLAKDAADRPSAAEIAAGALRGNDFGPPAAVAAAAVAGPATSPIEALESPNSHRKRAVLAGAIAVLATTATAMAVVLLNGNETKQPPTTDIGPQPGATSSTPAATRTSPSTTDPTQRDTRTQTTRTTSAPTSQTPSQQPSPSPTRTSTPSTTPSSTPSESTTPSVSPSPSASSSPTPSETPAPSTPATGSPSPDDQADPTQPGSD